MNEPAEGSAIEAEEVSVSPAYGASVQGTLLDRLIDWCLASATRLIASAFVALLLAGAVFYLLHVYLSPTVLKASNGFQSWTEHQNVLVAAAIIVLISLFSALSLFQFAYVRYMLSGGTNLRWIYTLIGGLILIATADIWTYVLHPSALTVQDLRQHVTWYAIRLHCDAFILLLAAGYAVYLFKQKSLIAYGFSEVLLSILSNLAVIDTLDLSHLPHLSLKGDQIIKLGAFTYLLSRGVGNVTEALGKKTKKAESVATSPDDGKKEQ